MDWLLDLTLRESLIFALVLGRVGGLMLPGPLTGGIKAPKHVRVLLVLALSVLITPAQFAAAIEMPQSWAGCLLALGCEVLIGYALGFGVAILFSGVQLAGQVIGQMSGVTLAEVYDPGFDTEIPLFSQLLHLLA